MSIDRTDWQGRVRRMGSHHVRLHCNYMFSVAKDRDEMIYVWDITSVRLNAHIAISQKQLNEVSTHDCSKRHSKGMYGMCYCLDYVRR